MKQWIHPQVHNTKTTCSCWASFTLFTTLPDIKVEVCSKCHQFYTWERKIDSRASRVAKFRERQEAAKKS